MAMTRPKAMTLGQLQNLQYQPVANTGGGNNTGYNIAPRPQGYQSAFGGQPGTVGIPNVAQQLEEQLPQNTQMKRLASQDVLSQLRGEISPDTVDMIQQAQAQWGVNAGIPGAGLAVNKGLRDLGLMAEDLQQRGIQNYSNLSESVSRTQTVSPETQINTALQNAINRAAPRPGDAARYSQSLFNKYMEKTGPQTRTVMTDVVERGINKKRPVEIPYFG